MGPGFDFDKGHAYIYVRSKKTATIITKSPNNCNAVRFQNVVSGNGHCPTKLQRSKLAIVLLIIQYLSFRKGSMSNSFPLHLSPICLT